MARNVGSDHEFDLQKWLLKYYQRYSREILVWGGVFVFLAVVIPGGLYYKSHIDNAAINSLDRGLALYEKARLSNDPASYVQAQAAFQQIVNSYALSSSTPVALLYMGNSFYQLGNFEEAKRAYGHFVRKYPKYSLAGLGQLGIASSLEMLNDFEAAVTEYQKLQQKYPQFVTADVRLSQAHCLEMLQRLDEAKAIYEELAPTNNLAKVRLMRLRPAGKA